MKRQHGHKPDTTRPARLIAVGNRIQIKSAASQATFAAELERIVSMAAP